MKTLFAFLLIVTSLSSFAQGRRNISHDGSIIMRDGKSTVRISVGKDDNELNMRVRRLEQAVSDLQAQVFDLQDSRPQTRVVTTVVCSMTTSFDGTFVGKGSTQIEAEAITRQKCEKSNASFCATTSVKCEQVQEEVVIR